MAFSATIVSGNLGSVTISEEAGVATLKASVGASVGGGSIAGAVKGQASLELDVSAVEFANAGLDLLAAKFPSIAPAIATVKALMDAELAKV